jgi:hypothetical protein
MHGAKHAETAVQTGWQFCMQTFVAPHTGLTRKHELFTQIALPYRVCNLLIKALLLTSRASPTDSREMALTAGEDPALAAAAAAAACRMSSLLMLKWPRYVRQQAEATGKAHQG